MPVKCRIQRPFIWLFNVLQSTRLMVSQANMETHGQNAFAYTFEPKYVTILFPVNIQNMRGKAILMCLIQVLVGVMM